MTVSIMTQEQRAAYDARGNLLPPNQDKYDETYSVSADGVEAPNGNENGNNHGNGNGDRNHTEPCGYFPRFQRLPVFSIRRSNKTVCELIDIGADLTNRAYKKTDMPYILERAGRAGIKYIIIRSHHLSSSRYALKLCEDFDNKYGGVRLRCVVGVSPENATTTLTKTDPDDERKFLFGGPTFDCQLEQIVRSWRGQKYVVGIGECGLDYTKLEANKDAQGAEVENQQMVLEMQLALAHRLALPIIVRARGAYTDLSNRIKPYLGIVRTLIASYDGTDIKSLKGLVEAGACIGLDSTFTRENMGRAKGNILKVVPWEKCMVASVSHESQYVPRNIKHLDWDGPLRNESCTLSFLVKRLAAVRHEDYETAAHYTSDAAMKFFGL